MSLSLSALKTAFIGFLILSVAIIGLAAAVVVFYSQQLPSVETLKDVQLQTPLKVFSRDGKLIAVFGEKRRIPVSYEEMPAHLVNAYLAAEDDRFYSHPGVDYQGIIRAGLNLIMTGRKVQGGSTITMQLARNFFLTPERTYSRKIKEILLALRIEKTLSKNEILELYLNKIYLGQRAYGVGAAAEVYYGKTIQELTIPQLAMIAGLPKAPSAYNPVTNAKRAKIRRDYVLGRMNKLKMITQQQYQEFLDAPIVARKHSINVEVDAPYIGEMVRAYMVETYGESAYSVGYNVYTTIDADKQQVAVRALQAGLMAYDMRHGYRGAEMQIEQEVMLDPDLLSEQIRKFSDIGPLQPGVVTQVDETTAQVIVDRNIITLDLEAVKWAREYLSVNALGPRPEKVTNVLAVGDVIRVQHTDLGWQLRQKPAASSAIVSIHPEDGSVVALVGGFDFYDSKFNRVIQASRQPGSSFKPFIYSAALEAGFTPASLVNDAPVVFESKQTEDAWRPHNYSGKFFGPTRLRLALTKSRNMVSIRLLRDIGKSFAKQHIAKFGFDTAQLPNDLTLALGSSAMTPMQIAQGYSVIANGGYEVQPYFIERIQKFQEDDIFTARPAVICDAQCMQINNEFSQLEFELEFESEFKSEAEMENDLIDEQVSTDMPPQDFAPRVVSESNIYQLTSMLNDVIQYGTGRRARVLERKDIAGKTGTTNDQTDAWFAGFHKQAATVVWLGFDDPQSLGRREAGGVAALPIWIDYMRFALKGVPSTQTRLPNNMVQLKVHPDTGLLVDDDFEEGIEEAFLLNQVPARHQLNTNQETDADTQGPIEQKPIEQLF
jgi:penicillin-binding protein 1A